ncbi:hypothetical protein NS365_05635 [Aureimonas ureilytica]|uniref:Uncharacterized protein n=1 Tax=Aureimonas ureilytica TaxID=401562 RepID=A0A175RTZ4_9HYPH|nr:hypothetical protein [Aureimonas ureilytica]KTR06913.1 hypothetical protein NS365_05635 [Aureimonas ureilytica]
MSKLAERITDLSLKDDLEEAIDDALRVTGGNSRAAIGALILGQRNLQEAYAARISAGYVKRKPS